MSENTPASSTSAENLKELPAVARNISLPCKKCGVERFHVVVAHTSPTSAKVKCEVCGSQKTFKIKTETQRKSSTGTKRVGTKSKKAPDVGAIWNELKAQIGTDNLVPYNMKTKFALANAINHPKFGIGFVTNATHDKIDVAFLEGGRSLVHNRP
jgi:hypothetical protein